MKRKMLFVGTVIHECDDLYKVDFGGLYPFWIPKFAAISRQSKSRRGKKA